MRSKIFEEEVPIEVEYVKNVQRARYIRTWIVASVVAAVVIAAFLEVPNLPCSGGRDYSSMQATRRK